MIFSFALKCNDVNDDVETTVVSSLGVLKICLGELCVLEWTVNKLVVETVPCDCLWETLVRERVGVLDFLAGQEVGRADVLEDTRSGSTLMHGSLSRVGSNLVWNKASEERVTSPDE